MSAADNLMCYVCGKYHHPMAGCGEPSRSLAPVHGSVRQDWVRPQPHDYEMNDRVAVHTLCFKCNKESEVPASRMLNGIFTANHTCPHCRATIQTWIRITVAPNVRDEPRRP